MSLFRHRKPAAPEPVRVTTRQGRKAHLKLGDRVLCPTSPGRDGWTACADDSLPVCTYCKDALAELTP
jgi:hypothetical protein